MRRLVILLVAVVAATSAYNLVIQEIALTGNLIADDTITLENIQYLHIDGHTKNFEKYEVVSPDDAKKIEARKIVYTDNQITTKSSKLNFEILMSDGSTFTFTLSPQMKTGVVQSPSGSGTWKPATTTVDPTATVPPTTTTTVAPAPPAVNCMDSANMGKGDCDCTLPTNDGADFCICITANNPPNCKTAPAGNGGLKPSKAVKKPVPRPKPVDSEADVPTIIVDALPPAIRLRGPGPVVPPIRQSPPVVTDEDDEERRVKRAAADGDPTKTCIETVCVQVSYYVLDEPGNAAAVWAAVIEGIILLLLVGACCYFFFWAPRARAAASATADPYKEQGPNYSVSYANSSFNQRNERIDAFQNPPAPTPAAPPRPANSAYMDDYITDNIGAMSRPGGTAQPAPAAAPAFEPRHQRFDSSGLVTVNLS